MSWLRLCNKNVLAVIGYFVLQILLVVGFCLTCSAIVDPDDDLVYLIFFWISVFVTLVLYIWLHFKDPGFIPHNNHSFRDQEENNFSRPKTSTRNESEMKFKALDSRNQSVHEHLPYELKIEIKEKATNINRVHMRRLKFSDAMTNSTTNLNTNMYTGKLSTQEKSTPVAGTLKTIKTQEAHEKEDKDEEFHKIETQLPSKDAARGSQNVVCEPSIDEKDEGEESSGSDYHGPVDFNVKSKEALEVSEEGIEMQNFSPQATKDTFLFPIYKVSRESNHQVNLKTVHSNMDDHEVDSVQRRIKTEMEPVVRKKVYSYTRRSMSNHDFVADASCNVPLQTGDEDKTKEYKLEEIHMRIERYPTRNMADGLAPRHIKPAFISKPLVKIESPLESPLGRKDLDISNLRPPSEGGCSDRDNQLNTPSKDAKPNGNYKDGVNGGNQQEHSINAQGQNHRIELNDQEEAEAQARKKDSTDIFYVEKRYCTVCNLEQPFRAKHCKDCNRCIGKYDHHCPWLGNCVGEKNHCLFYWFLVFQITEIVLGQIKMYICTLSGDYEGSLAIKIIILAVSTIFLAMTASLLVFHTFLALKNLTTWEALSWNKITYLSDWPKSWGSPFSKGILQNTKYFCWKRKKELTQWEMPRYRKPLSQQPKDNL